MTMPFLKFKKFWAICEANSTHRGESHKTSDLKNGPFFKDLSNKIRSELGFVFGVFHAGGFACLDGTHEPDHILRKHADGL